MNHNKCATARVGSVSTTVTRICERRPRIASGVSRGEGVEQYSFSVAQWSGREKVKGKVIQFLLSTALEAR